MRFYRCLPCMNHHFTTTTTTPTNTATAPLRWYFLTDTSLLTGWAQPDVLSSVTLISTYECVRMIVTSWRVVGYMKKGTAGVKSPHVSQNILRV